MGLALVRLGKLPPYDEPDAATDLIVIDEEGATVATAMPVKPYYWRAIDQADRSEAQQ